MAQRENAAAENPAYRQAFSTMDRNADGRVDKQDLIELLNALNQSPTEDDVKKIMNELAGDAQSIDFRRYCALQQTVLNDEKISDGYEALFNLFDKDKDGLLNKVEIEDAFRALGEEVSETELADLLAFSQSKTGLSLADFVAALSADKSEKANNLIL